MATCDQQAVLWYISIKVYSDCIVTEIIFFLKNEAKIRAAWVAYVYLLYT